MAQTMPARQPAPRTIVIQRPCSSPSRNYAATRGPWPPVDALNSMAPVSRPRSASSLLNRPGDQLDARFSHGTVRSTMVDALPRDDVYGRPRQDDLAALIDFFRNHAPPAENFMSEPYEADNDGRHARWSKIRKIGKRSSTSVLSKHTSMRLSATRSRGKSSPQIRLPDTAVSGTTTGGHRHIAISIPLAASPLGSMPRSQYPVIAPHARQAGRREPIRTFVNDKGVLTVLRAVSEEYEPPSPAPSGPLPPLPFSHVRRSPGPYSQGSLSRQSTNGSRASIESTKQTRSRLLSSRSDPMLLRQDSVNSDSHGARQRPLSSSFPNRKEFQRSAYPVRASSRQLGHGIQQARSIDGILAQYDTVVVEDRPVRREKRKEFTQDVGEELLLTQSSSGRPSTSSGVATDEACYDMAQTEDHEQLEVDDYDDTPLLSRDEDYVPRVARQTTRSRRDIVKDKKKRDIEAMKQARLQQQLSAQQLDRVVRQKLEKDGNWKDESSILKQLDAADSPIITRSQTPDDEANSMAQEVEPQPREEPSRSQFKLCPIMVVIDEEPSSPALKGEADGESEPSKTHTRSSTKSTVELDLDLDRDHENTSSRSSLSGTSTRRRHTIDRTSLSRRREWNASRERGRQMREALAPTGTNPQSFERVKASKADLDLLRLFDAYRDERFVEMENTIQRLERNGDIWLRTLIPMLESMNRAMATIAANNQKGERKSRDDFLDALERSRKRASSDGNRHSSAEKDRVRNEGQSRDGKIGESVDSDALVVQDHSSSSSRRSSIPDTDMAGLRALAPLLMRMASEAQKIKRDSGLVGDGDEEGIGSRV